MLAALFLALIWAATTALPHLPWLVLGLVWLVLAAPVALVPAWVAAVRRGHGLRVLSDGARVYLASGLLRVVLAGLAGLVAAALVLLRLFDQPLLAWLPAVAALAGPILLLPVLTGRLRDLSAGPHVLRFALPGAVLSGVALGLVTHALLVWLTPSLPQVAAPVAAASALAAEALTLARLWAGLEAFALGQLAGFGDWGRWAATVLALALHLGTLAAMALTGASLMLPPGEAARALAPASDTVDVPRPGRVGVAAVLILCLAVLAGGAALEQRLNAVPPDARPVAQLQTAAERIGDAFFLPGTHAQLQALRRDALAQDTALTRDLVVALEAGFDAMEANVDGFLDGYYSLWGEYLRLFHWATFRLEGHLQRRLEEALTEGVPHEQFQTLLADALTQAEARRAALAEAEADLLVQNRIEEENPALLRLENNFAPLPTLNDRFTSDLHTAQQRWAVAGGAGAVTAIIGARVAQRLAARGVLRVAATALSRVAGVFLAVGVDYALVRLDEAQNRDSFRAEILSEINRLKAEALSSLPAGDIDEQPPG